MSKTETDTACFVVLKLSQPWGKISWKDSCSQILISSGVPMADANDNDPDVELTGPSQKGRGVHGQYVYWICMQHPKPETAQRTGVKTLADIDRITLRRMFAKSHQSH